MSGDEVDPSPLDADALVAEVIEATGLDDFGEDTWREGLEQLLDSLRSEARLHELGVFVAADDARMNLTNRLEVTDWHRRHPDMGAGDVTPPIVVVGQGRTGTTILLDLLAQDPAHRVPLTWEVDQPCPPPETATYDTDPRIAISQAKGAPRPGVCAHRLWLLSNPAFTDAVPGAVVRPVAARRGRHGPRLPVAPPGAPAPPVASPR